MPILGLNFNRNMVTDQFSTVGRAVYGSLNARQLNSKAVAIPMAPLIPMIIAGSALLYHQGNQAAKPNGGDKNAWLQILLESAVGCWVLQHTTGLYPLFGLGLAAYRSGQKNTAQEKIQALINTAVSLTMGWAGVHLFESFSEAGRANDDHIIHNALLGKGKHEAKVKQWLDSHLTHLAQTDEEAKGLKDSLLELRKTLGEKKALYDKNGKFKGKPDWEIVEPLSEKASNIKNEIVERLGKVGDKLYTDMAHDQKMVVRAALSKIEDSQSSFTQLNRAMNPVYGYIIVGLMLGTPLAKWISSKIGDRRPELKGVKFDQQNLFPQDNRVITNQTYGFRGYGAHGAPAGGAHPPSGTDHKGLAGHNSKDASHFMMGTPTIAWPGVIGDKQAH